MRYEKGHKDETRLRIIEGASQRFRRDGVNGTGIATLMASAGLTHGGFYAHFSSKDELVREAMISSLAETREMLRAEAARARRHGRDGLEAIVRRYLRAVHRDGPERGCAVAALASDLARHDPETRAVVTDAISELVDLIASELPPQRSVEQSLKVAQTIFALMVGTLQLARLAGGTAAADQILRSGRAAALALARHEPGDRRR